MFGYVSSDVMVEVREFWVCEIWHLVGNLEMEEEEAQLFQGTVSLRRALEEVAVALRDLPPSLHVFYIGVVFLYRNHETLYIL